MQKILPTKKLSLSFSSNALKINVRMFQGLSSDKCWMKSLRDEFFAGYS